jgi:hypothetical protein
MRVCAEGWDDGRPRCRVPAMAPLQGPATSLRVVGGSGVLYLMPPAKPWMNFFWAKR